MENRSGRQTYTNKKTPEKMMKEILGEVFSINHAPTVFGRNSENAKPRDIFDS